MPKRCSKCTEPAHSKSGHQWLCVLHYRLRQMQHSARRYNKVAPTDQVLIEMIAALGPGLHCPVCKRQMNLLASDGQSTCLTLQHDRSGALRLICKRCNNRHQYHPLDSFYDLPAGHKRCPGCRTVKPFAEFYQGSDLRYIDGRRSYCRACYAVKAVQRRLRLASRLVAEDDAEFCQKQPF